MPSAIRAGTDRVPRSATLCFLRVALKFEKGQDMAESNIESGLLEERAFPPSRGFAAQARLKPADLQKLQKAAAADHAGFWADLARKELVWHEPFTVALDESNAPNYRWFSD